MTSMHQCCGLRSCERPDAMWHAFIEFQFDDRGHMYKAGNRIEKLIAESGEVLAEHELTEAEFAILYPRSDESGDESDDD